MITSFGREPFLYLTELGLGESAADTSRWRVNYEYGELQSNGQVNAAMNTGNIAKQTLTIPGTSFVQGYYYDPLYRLVQANEKTGTVENWLQNWTYDRYGNRTSFTQNIGGITTAPNPSVNTQTNRFNTGQNIVYDKNGNVVQNLDGLTSEVRSFVFNGDNKQTEVIDGESQTIARYYYDGEGKRVKKYVATTGETTVFVYSSGKLVAEYSTTVEPSTTAKVAYTTTDHLGTPRVITDQFGDVISRRDFMPFGEEIYQNVGGRSSGMNYGSGSDKVRQKFTGYQKDTETSLDFAEARMYENRFGRFTAVDPLMASGKSSDPQTFNRYVYSLNSPIKFTDVTGLYPVYYRYDKKTKTTTYQTWKSKGFKPYEGKADVFIHNGYWWRVTSSEIKKLYAVQSMPVNDTTSLSLRPNTDYCQLLPIESDFFERSPFDEDLLREDYLERLSEQKTAPYSMPVGPGFTETDPRDQFTGVAPTVDMMEDEGRPSVPQGPPVMPSGTSTRWENHHVYPQALKSEFEARGININLYTLRIPREIHRQLHGNRGGIWNQEWRDFFQNNPNAKRSDIQSQATDMIFRHNLVAPMMTYNLVHPPSPSVGPR